jgi:hypothetical protein
VPGDVVVRQQHLGHARGRLGLVVAQPAQLGDRERRHQDAAGHLGTRLRSAHLGDQGRGLGGRPGVVPEQRVAHRLPVVTERDHAVLLTPDRHRVGALEQACGGDVDRAQPGPRIHLGPRRMRRLTCTDHAAVIGVDQQCLGRLRRGVDTKDEGHAPYLVRHLN